MSIPYEAFEDGMMFKASIEGDMVTGEVAIDDEGGVFLCQNHADGASTHDKRGYKYSWILLEDSRDQYEPGFQGVNALQIFWVYDVPREYLVEGAEFEAESIHGQGPIKGHVVELHGGEIFLCHDDDRVNDAPLDRGDTLGHKYSWFLLGHHEEGYLEGDREVYGLSVFPDGLPKKNIAHYETHIKGLTAQKEEE